MFFQQLKLESARIFGIKRYIIFFTLFFVLGITFILSGIFEYQNYLDQKKFFVDNEQNKVDFHFNYDYWSGCCLRVLYQPPPLCIFFYNSDIFNNLSSTVNFTGTLDVHQSYKGSNLLFKRGFFKDLAGIFFLFGSLFMVYMGLSSYKSENYFFKFGNIIIRLVLLNLIFIILILSCYFLPNLFHIKFPSEDNTIFFKFSIYLFIFLDFFYGAGFFIRVLSRNKYHSYIYAFFFWLFSLILIPETLNIFLQNRSLLLPVNENFNITLTNELNNFESTVKKAMDKKQTKEERNMIYSNMAKNFLDNLCVKMSKIEAEKIQPIQEVIHKFETTVSLYPTCFFIYLSGEVSGRGYNGYINFVKYSTSVHCNALKYCLTKKNESKDNAPFPIIRKEENIFYATGFIPHMFQHASLLTLFYTLFFFLVSYRLLKRRANRKIEIEVPAYEFRKGNTYFVLCKNNKYKDNLFQYYQAKENTIGIDKVEVEDIDFGVGLAHMITYFCKYLGINEAKAWKNLRLLGIEDDYIKKQFHLHRKQQKQIPDEIIYKIYCAVIMAGPQEILVIKDFLKGKSREIEHHFLELVTHLNSSGKIIVYLSTEIFLTSLPLDGKIKIDSYKSFKIDPQAVSLR